MRGVGIAGVCAAIAVAVVAACDLTPAPQRSPQPQPSPQPPPQPQPQPSPSPDPDPRPAPGPDPIVPSKACVGVAAHVAELLVAGEADAARRAVRAQGRTIAIRETAAQCTRDHWSDAGRACLLAATDAPAMQPCEAMVGALPTPPSP